MKNLTFYILISKVLEENKHKKLREIFVMESNEVKIDNLKGLIYNGVVFSNNKNQDFMVVSEYWIFERNKFTTVYAYDIKQLDNNKIYRVPQEVMSVKVYGGEITIKDRPGILESILDISFYGLKPVIKLKLK